MRITIEYCVTCNYRPIAAALAVIIRNEFGVTPLLVQSTAIGTYTVLADGETVFSKNEAGRFPDNDEILDLLRKRMAGTRGA